MKPKLLVVTSTFPRWRDDTDPPFVYELSRRLADYFDVTVHAPHYPGSLRNEQMGGMRIHRFRYFFSPFEMLAGGQGVLPKMRRNKLYCLVLPFFLISQFISFILLVTRIKPDIIHAHWLIPQGFWAAVTRKLFKVPVVITVHGADVFSLRTPVLKKIKKWIVKNADRIVTVSSALADVLATDTQCERPPDTISMGVDGLLFSPDKNNEVIRTQYGLHGPFLLFVGRLSEKKGVRYLIDAMSLVTNDFPGAKLLIVGQGELEKELRNQVQIRGLEGVILFAGAVPNAQLPAYYASADCFIGPSVQVKDGDTEGLPVTFIEAAMSGCLVIGTKVGGVAEVVLHGQTGYVVLPEDTQALAEAIISVLEQKETLLAMKNKGRLWALQNFEWGVITHRYEELLKHAIATKKV